VTFLIVWVVVRILWRPLKPVRDMLDRSEDRWV
jgi:hypothetical protein